MSETLNAACVRPTHRLPHIKSYYQSLSINPGAWIITWYINTHLHNAKIYYTTTKHKLKWISARPLFCEIYECHYKKHQPAKISPDWTGENNAWSGGMSSLETCISSCAMQINGAQQGPVRKSLYSLYLNSQHSHKWANTLIQCVSHAGGSQVILP